jgi:hypothetical protein
VRRVLCLRAGVWPLGGWRDATPACPPRFSRSHFVPAVDEVHTIEAWA